MTTLAKRATPSQAKMLRIIEGAVLNTEDAHNQKRDEKLARSIAKRATGTLSAQWPEVLAANKLSKAGTVTDSNCPTCGRRVPPVGLARRERTTASYSAKADTVGSAAQIGGRHIARRRPPILKLWGKISSQMREVKRSGDQSKLEAYTYFLRLIDQVHKTGKT